MTTQCHETREHNALHLGSPVDGSHGYSPHLFTSDGLSDMHTMSFQGCATHQRFLGADRPPHGIPYYAQSSVSASFAASNVVLPVRSYELFHTSLFDQ